MQRALAAVLILWAAAFTPKANTRHEIKKYVHAAAAHIAEHGPSCHEFAGPEWRSGDYYIFVLGPDGRTLCHPDPSMLGREVPEIAAAAKHFGGGWVDYTWPGSGKSMSTYAQRVKSPDGDTYVVGSGGYGLK